MGCQSKLVFKPGMQAVQINSIQKKGLFIPIDAVIREENNVYGLKKSWHFF
jgi:hypothetical protein